MKRVPTPHSSGAQVIIEESHELPIVALQMVFRTGSAMDPPGREGLARMTTEVLRRGTTRRSRTEIDELIDALGAELSCSTGHDSLAFSVHVLKRNLAPVIELLCDIIGDPVFPDDEIERVRGEMLAALDELRDDDRDLCARHFSRYLYGDHPYGRPTSGYVTSLKTIRKDDLREFYRNNLRPELAVVGFSGDLDEELAMRLADQLLERLPHGKGSPPPRPPAPPNPPGRVVLLVDKPQRTQVQTLLGHPAPQWGTPEYDALQLTMTAFGGVFTARLMTEVRVKRGLSYGAYASVHGGRGRAHCEMWVFPGAADAIKTLRLVLSLYDDLAKGGLSDDEIAFARQYLVGHYPLAIETPERRLMHRVDLAICELPPDFLWRYPQRMGSIGPEQARSTIQQHVTPRQMAIAMVAEAKTIQPELEQLAPELGITRIDIVAHDAF